MDLCSALEAAAADRPDRAAIIFRGRRITYGELRSSIRSCAAGLARLGVAEGDRFALVMRNSPEFVVYYYALARLGAIVVPINFLFRPGEARCILEHSGSVGAAAQGRFVDIVREAAEGLPNFRHLICCDSEDHSVPTGGSDDEAPVITARGGDVATILYTSGTTGKPKGVMLTHDNLLSNVESCRRAISVREDDVFMCLLPMFHTFAWTTCVVLPLTVGNTTVVVESIQPFRPVAAQVRRHRVSIFIAVPPIFAAMTRVPFWRPLRFLLPLRLCISGAAPLPRSVLANFEAKFGVPLLEGYGLTEASPVVSLNPLNGEHRPGAVGFELPDVEVKVVLPDGSEAARGEVGEICVRGPNVMLGYYNDPAATAEAVDAGGWLHTQDLGRRDPDGYIEIVDRAKDMVIVKGLNVYPREVEEVIVMHPHVAEVAVLGVPDDQGDERIKAFVVPKEGRHVDKSELLSLCREHLAPYKWPRDVVLASFLPKNSVGKVLKRELKEEAGAAVS